MLDVATQLIVLIVALLGARDAPRCTMDFLIVDQSPGVAYILADALTDTVAAPDASNLILSDSVGDLIPMAQRFAAIRIAGAPVGVSVGDTFRVVPWEYGSDCEPLPWRSSARWVRPGTQVLFRLGRSRHAYAGEATFDVLGWLAPYPSAALWPQVFGADPPEDREEWLTATEYFDLILQLPEDPWDRVDRRVVLERVENLVGGSARWRSSFPATAVLERYRYWARQ